MRDRGAERAVLGAFRVDVDPLVIAGGVGEFVDLFLGDFAVFGDAEVGSGEGGQFVEVDDEIGHLLPPVVVFGLRKYDGGAVLPPSGFSCCSGSVAVRALASSVSVRRQRVKALSPVRARPTMRALISWVPS